LVDETKTVKLKARVSNYADDIVLPGIQVTGSFFAFVRNILLIYLIKIM